MKSWVFVAGVAAAGAFLLLAARADRESGAPGAGPPVLGAVPEFLLRDSSGAEFPGGRLRGRPWIANFIFTRCQETCPLLTRRLRKVREELAGRADVRSVSISVDPAHDTPAALRLYARKQGADLPGWHFLTGDERAVRDLLAGGFRIGGLDRALVHSDRFVLVDGEGRIRGYYASSDADALARLREDALAVAGPPDAAAPAVASR